MNKNFNDEKLFRFLLKCQKNCFKNDLHTFLIDIKDGRAYVECRGHNEVYIEERIYGNEIEKVNRWCGNTLAAANRLEKHGADFLSIDM